MTLGISITIFQRWKLAFYACLLGQFFFSLYFQKGTALSSTTFCVVMERDGGYRYYIIYSFIQLFYYFSFYFVIIIILLLLLLFYLLFLGGTRQARK